MVGSSLLPVTCRYLNQNQQTPLVALQLFDPGPVVWCKLEFFNPSGSTKDRISHYILEKAWRRGEIGPGSLVVEASSGSTSIAMALTCAQLGLRFAAVLPEGVSNERSLMIRSYGGQVVFSPKSEGIRGALIHAERLACEQNGYQPRQFENMDNANAHRTQTAREILMQIPGGVVDAVVSGVGTGGTLVGLAQGFRDAGCQTIPFAARPTMGTCLAEVECSSFSSRIPGVADGISQIYSRENLPGVCELDVNDEEAMGVTRMLIRRGFPVGPSSGLNYQAAVLAAQKLPPGKQIVTVFPDRMERYFSTELFQGWKDLEH